MDHIPRIYYVYKYLDPSYEVILDTASLTYIDNTDNVLDIVKYLLTKLQIPFRIINTAKYSSVKINNYFIVYNILVVLIPFIIILN